MVIGKEVEKETNVTELNYHEYVFGYTIGLDVSARDWQAKSKNGGQILIAKSMDGFLPLGILIWHIEINFNNSNIFYSELKFA